MPNIPEDVLIIEDDVQIARLVAAEMSKIWPVSSTSYHFMPNLQRALDFLAVFTPDFIMLDLNLPDSEGLATLQAILNVPHMQSIPIVVMSGYITDMEGLQALHHGAADYIVKGSKANTLLTVAKAWARHCGHVLSSDVHPS